MEHTIPLRRADVRTRRYRGVLVIATSERAFELNEEAEFVFRAIDGAATVHDIAARLADRYRYALLDAIADTWALVEALAERNVVVTAPGQAGATSSYGWTSPSAL
ncbi:PqqD family protein [Actinokineospora globicatena]|uniref:PqqD family protein n=1 Tax=Actinokineospora globicatena TaxID=103729 RepID=UPI0020A4BA41|nr:PqqD family protein [Actinokineospora globicatena]